MYQYTLSSFCHFQNFNLAVNVPGLEESSQTLKIRMLPGNKKHDKPCLFTGTMAIVFIVIVLIVIVKSHAFYMAPE